MKSNIIHLAIHKINPNATFQIMDNDTDKITWTEGTTPIPVADIEAMIAQMPTAEELDAQKETDSSSGKQKLKDLGLTDAEIKALTGA